MKKVFPIIVILVVFLILMSAAIFLIANWNKPLGVSLEMPTPTFALEDTNPSPETISGAPSSSISQSTEQVAPETYCGGPPLMYILAIGADNETNDYTYGLADAIRIARVDFVTPKVTILTIPRDLWVEFPEIKPKFASTLTHGKLNQAYFYGGPGMGYYDGPGGGPGLLARTLAHNYGISVDHYAAVNMVAFENIIDAIGGIDLYLDQPWDGTPIDENTEDMGYFPAGQHHMSGEEALRFARIRKRYSTIVRSDNQNLVMCAVMDKVLKPAIFKRIPRLIDALIGEIHTDLTPSQISQLACLLPNLNADNLHFIRFPDEMLVPGRVFDPNLGNTTFVFDVPQDIIRAYVDDFMNDAIPLENGKGMTCP